MTTCHSIPVFSATTVLMRKLRRPRRFDRVRAARPLYDRLANYWHEGIRQLLKFMQSEGRWERLSRRYRLQAMVGPDQLQKGMSDEERSFLVSLLAEFGYYADVERMAEIIVEATLVPTYEAAAAHALRLLGVQAPQFELRNQSILDNLMERKSATIFATRHHIDQVFETISRNFHALGRHPFDEKFLAELREDLGNVANYQAKRFSLTETGIAAEMAQLDTYQRNGVRRKRWNILGRNTRDSHERMDGVEADIDEMFLLVSSDGEKHQARMPLDPNLPAHELVNCHCWLSAVVNDDFQLDPRRIWEGQ